jgi:two-component system phosphate regulon response regulator OmpR
MTRLRRKIESNPKFPRYLQTVRGTGYVLVTD